MLRADREIKDNEEIIKIVKNCNVVNVAFKGEGDYPYIVPLNFGFSCDCGKNLLYLHCAKKGKKLDLIKKNPCVALSMYCDTSLGLDKVACKCTMKYKSVCGIGTIKEVDEDEGVKALNSLMSHYSNADFMINAEMTKNVRLLKLEIESWTGKAN